MPSIQDFLQLVGTGGTVTVLVLLVYGFLTERIVPRGRLDDERAQKKEAMDLARSALASMDRLSDAVEARNALESRRLEIEARSR